MASQDPLLIPGQENLPLQRWGRVRRPWLWGLYPLLWLLTFVGVRSPQPQLLGIPLWYWGAGLVTLALVPLNVYLVRASWPETPSFAKDPQPTGDG